MELISIIILLIYLVFIGLLIFGFDRVKTSENKDLKPQTTFSIVVPFRNEEIGFLKLLQSISELNYPKSLFEIIVVDDNSEDASAVVFEKWKALNLAISSSLLQNIRISNSPKKDAITTAVFEVKKEWVITTDADCIVPKNWLLSLDNIIKDSNFEMISGAVSISEKKGFLNFFQYLDILSLQGTTIGSFGINKPFMCNGANFGYTKKLFLDLKGFDGNDKMSSGDDVFLLQKAIKQFPEKVGYLKNREAIVVTKSETSWSNLFKQRVRWASKTSSYNGCFAKSLAISVLAINLVLVGLLFFGYWKLFLGIFAIKFVIDFVLLYKTHRFVGNKNFFFPILCSLFYPFFSSFVAIYSFFGKFDWKGRSYRK